MLLETPGLGQVDFPELPETPEITEIIENFIKVTKHLTKRKETLTNYVWEKLTSKNSKNETFRRFRVFECVLW